MKNARAIAIVAFAVAGAAPPAAAHGDPAQFRAAWWTAWSWEPGVVTSLFVTAAIYGAGLRTLRLATRSPRKLRIEAWHFWAGWAFLTLGLVSPLHAWGSLRFSAHMTQHEVLMVAAAPLMVLGRPGTVMLFAFPSALVRRVFGGSRELGISRVSGWMMSPLGAWLVHAVALWVWHIPRLFEATLTSEWVHAVQHASFFGTAVLFWHAVFYGPRRRTGYGLAVLNLFTTAVHSGALGALLTFGHRPWYPAYATRAAAWGLSPVEDQQLGGLIMWIPAGMVYMLAALVLFGAWLRDDRNAVSSATSPVCVSS